VMQRLQVGFPQFQLLTENSFRWHIEEFYEKRFLYGAQNEAYMSRSAEKWVRGLCFNELGVCG